MARLYVRPAEPVSAHRLASSVTAETNATHRADIDGLRAVAVVLVLLYHTGLGFPGGFVGVDVFFVISGYLITGIILRDLEAGVFSLREFWLRRIRRIAPAAVVLTAATLAAGLVLLLPSSLVKLAESAIAQQLLVANVYFSRAGGYFDGPAEMKPLLHTWSLAVEEQFYLLFPVALLACRRRSRRFIASALAAACLASLALSVAISDRFPTANFYWLPPRAWELLLGAILAASPTAPIVSASARNWVGILGLALIGACGVLYSRALPFPGITALIPTLGTVAVIAAGSAGPTAASRFLSIAPMAWVGSASYSIYLWHWPILVFLRHELGRNLPPAARWGAAAASLVLGFVSWALVEEPIRRRRIFAAPPRLFGLYAGASVYLLGVSLTFLWGDGLPGRSIAQRSKDVQQQRLALMKILDPGAASAPNMITIGDESASGPSFLVWGDSHTACVTKLCGDLARDRHLSGYSASRGGQTPLLGVSTRISGIAAPDEQVEWNREMIALVRRRKIRAVILACRWESKLRGHVEGGRYRDLMQDALTTQPSPEDARRVFKAGLLRTLSTLESAGAKVWLLAQVPVQDEDLIDRIACAKVAVSGDRPTGVSRAAYDRQQQPFVDVLSGIDRPNLTLLGPRPDWFDAGGNSRLVLSGVCLYIDDDHVCERGAEVYYRELLKPVFDEIAGSAVTPHSPR